MKSRQFIWLLLFSTALNLNCFALINKSDLPPSIKKVFILIRSEENPYELERIKEQISKDLQFQDIVVEIETYRRSEPLPQAKIFKTAYSGDYDVLLLIEQIAKYSLDSRVTNSKIKMGGKYKIRSYNLKEMPFTWIDHGNSNCNLSVDSSLMAFTGKILATFQVKPSPQNYDSVITDGSNMDNDMLQYQRLMKEVKLQRQKTRMLLNKIEELKLKLKIQPGFTQDIAQLKVE